MILYTLSLTRPPLYQNFASCGVREVLTVRVHGIGGERGCEPQRDKDAPGIPLKVRFLINKQIYYIQPACLGAYLKVTNCNTMGMGIPTPQPSAGIKHRPFSTSLLPMT